MPANYSPFEDSDPLKLLTDYLQSAGAAPDSPDWTTLMQRISQPSVNPTDAPVPYVPEPMPPQRGTFAPSDMGALKRQFGPLLEAGQPPQPEPAPARTGGAYTTDWLGSEPGLQSIKNLFKNFTISNNNPMFDAVNAGAERLFGSPSQAPTGIAQALTGPEREPLPPPVGEGPGPYPGTRAGTGAYGEPTFSNRDGSIAQGTAQAGNLDSLRAFTQTKYGGSGRYGGAGGEAAAFQERLGTLHTKLTDQLIALGPPRNATDQLRMSGLQEALNSIETAQQESHNSESQLIKTLSDLEQQQRARQESTNIARIGQGLPVPTGDEVGYSKEGLGQINTFLSGRRADANADRADARLGLQLSGQQQRQTNLANRPISPALINQRAQQIIGLKGMNLTKEGIFQGAGRSPIPNWQQVWAQARMQAEQELQQSTGGVAGQSGMAGPQPSASLVKAKQVGQTNPQDPRFFKYEEVLRGLMKQAGIPNGTNPPVALANEAAAQTFGR